MATVQLKFRAADKDIFNAILDGRKKVETRAASSKFKNLHIGDKIVLVCGNEKKEKIIQNIQHFKTIDEMLNVYKVRDINPNLKSKDELIKMYGKWPNYKEKINKFGLVAMEFE